MQNESTCKSDSISRRDSSSLYTAELLTSGLIEIANELVNSSWMMLINDFRDEDTFAGDFDEFSLNSRNISAIGPVPQSERHVRLCL